MKHLLLVSALAASGSLSSQYCTSGGPSSTVDSNVQLVRIVGQGDSIHHVGCPGVIGVQNLTNLDVTVNASSTYPLTVQFGTCNGNYAGAGEVWIDYDQSGSFDPTESVGTWQGIPPVPANIYNVTIPANAFNGATRMRVMQREGSVPPPLDPCATFTWGSVMDFTVIIQGGLDCSAYLGDTYSDAIQVASLPYTTTGDNSYCYANQNPVYNSADVYYLVFPSPQSFVINASLCGSSYDTFISAVDPQGNVLAYNDDGASCAPQSEMTIPSAGQDSIYIIVEGWGVSEGAYTLQLSEQLVGIEDLGSPSYTLYPNPANEFFIVQGAMDATVEITDVTGKVVQSFDHYSGSQITTVELAPGLYFIRLSENDNSFTTKITIER